MWAHENAPVTNVTGAFGLRGEVLAESPGQTAWAAVRENSL